jgi:hypothetical protein
MNPPRRGDIVLVPFPHPDLRGLKRRPACVVSATIETYLVNTMFDNRHGSDGVYGHRV